MTRLLSFLLALGMLALPVAAFAADARPTPPKAKLLFVTTTGLEDIEGLSSSFRHALVATKSEHVAERRRDTTRASPRVWCVRPSTRR